jgi:hypothetical protein
MMNWKQRISLSTGIFLFSCLLFPIDRRLHDMLLLIHVRPGGQTAGADKMPFHAD